MIPASSEDREQPTLLSGAATGERLRRLLEGGLREGATRAAADPRAPWGGTPSESLNRVPPSGKTGDTRVRAAPHRLLNRESDGWGKGNRKTLLGKENQ